MKTLFAAVLLATLAAPAMAQMHFTTADGVRVESAQPGLDIFGRRSHHCREGSTCGGV